MNPQSSSSTSTIERSDHAQLLKRMLLYLKPYCSWLWGIGICILATTVIGFITPLLIRKITDDGMLRRDFSVILVHAIPLITLNILNQAIELVLARVFAEMHNRSWKSLFEQSLNKLLRLKVTYYTDKSSTEILDTVRIDVNAISEITEQHIILSMMYLFKALSGIAGLLYISWSLTLVVLSLVPVKFIMISIFSRLKEHKNSEMNELNRKFSAWFGDIIDGIHEIKLWNLYEKQLLIFQKRIRGLIKNNLEHNMLDAWHLFIEATLEWVINIVLYILGGALVCNNTFTIGSVFAFITFSMYVVGPIMLVMNIKLILARIYPSARRLFTFLDFKEESFTGNEDCNNDIQSITFDRVSFAYNNQRKVLNSISFRIDCGEKIAIIGDNGSGKSTILHLLLRFIEPAEGNICFNENSITTYEIKSYRNQFAVVCQDPYLFSDTVHNNINLDNKATMAEVQQACIRSGAWSFINALPERGNSLTGHNGAMLSGGEKQKIAVARAVLRNASIIILDEATSGYDMESDKNLQQVIQEELQEKTVLLVTHRYSNLENMDRVYRLEHGVLLEIDKQTVM